MELEQKTVSFNLEYITLVLSACTPIYNVNTVQMVSAELTEIKVQFVQKKNIKP